MPQSKSLRYYVIIALLLLLPLSSCGPQYKAARTERQTEKKKEKRRMEGEKAMQKAKEDHIKAQSKDTRKRMKETRRKSRRVNNYRKEPFYERWYKAIFRRR